METTVKPVFLKPHKERAIENRHPWVFSGAIGKIDDTITIGDAVKIIDYNKKPVALGHWCGNDGLVIRIISFDPNQVIDEAFYLDRLHKAKALRAGLGLPNTLTNGYRLIHGEGDGLSGLVCDVYSDVASIQCSNPGLFPIIKTLSMFLVDHCGVNHIFAETSDNKKGRWLYGETDDISFLENSGRFLVNLDHGQKTGHFLDQRDNRMLVRNYASGRTVLDTFCYSGGFSVNALIGKARSVTSVDISENAIAACQNNVSLNIPKVATTHHAIKADVFDYLRKLDKDYFDLIILDPPAFAKTSHAVMQASRGYKDINLLALKAIRAGGLIFTFSCSQHIDIVLFKKIIFAAAKDSGRDVKIIHELGQGLDHPVSVYCPQSSYLKGLVLYIE